MKCFCDGLWHSTSSHIITQGWVYNDGTLTKPGEAADAKKTGDGLSSANTVIEQLTQDVEGLRQQVAEYNQQLEQYKQQQSQTITGITNAITAIGGDVTGTQEDKTWLITS